MAGVHSVAAKVCVSCTSPSINHYQPSEPTMISEEVPLSCGEYTVSVTRGEAPKKPNVVYVTEQAPCGIGCYIYAIPGKKSDVYTAVLQASGDNTVSDLAHRLGRVLVKKSGCPSYVCVSGSVSELDQMELMGRVVAMVSS